MAVRDVDDDDDGSSVAVLVDLDTVVDAAGAVRARAATMEGRRDGTLNRQQEQLHSLEATFSACERLVHVDTHAVRGRGADTATVSPTRSNTALDELPATGSYNNAPCCSNNSNGSLPELTPAPIKTKLVRMCSVLNSIFALEAAIEVHAFAPLEALPLVWPKACLSGVRYSDFLPSDLHAWFEARQQR
jgi:hypothetical protein